MVKTNDYLPETVSHPGLVLNEKLNELSIGYKEFSVKISESEQTIEAIIKGDSLITTKMALKFEKTLKIPVSFWLSRQKRVNKLIK